MRLLYLFGGSFVLTINGFHVPKFDETTKIAKKASLDDGLICNIRIRQWEGCNTRNSSRTVWKYDMTDTHYAACLIFYTLELCFVSLYFVQLMKVSWVIAAI